jgi:hypothetical protein
MRLTMISKMRSMGMVSMKASASTAVEAISTCRGSRSEAQ